MKREISRETFYKNGNIHQRFTYKDGTPVDEDGFPSHGLREYFYENGQLWIRGNFEEDKQVGLWEYFDQKGNLDHTEEYKDGEPIE